METRNRDQNSDLTLDGKVKYAIIEAMDKYENSPRMEVSLKQTRYCIEPDPQEAQPFLYVCQWKDMTPEI